MDLIAQIRSKIMQGRLASTEQDLSGYIRPSVVEARQRIPPPKESAVLFPVYLRQGVWHTLFIRRPADTGVHSSQLSFPGGRIEPGESGSDAALRETHEEIGIAPAAIRIECCLSEIFIPPSNFIVNPHLGIITGTQEFAPNPAEVDEIIEYPLGDLLRSNIIVQKDVFVAAYQKEITVRAFDILGHTLWGATAMMVQEFRSVMGYRD